MPDATEKTYTQQVMTDDGVPQDAAGVGTHQIPPNQSVPCQIGDPSVFKHVVYILRKTKPTIRCWVISGRGNSDPTLCTYGQASLPNHHALPTSLSAGQLFCNQRQLLRRASVGPRRNHRGNTLKKVPHYEFGTDAPLLYASSDFYMGPVASYMPVASGTMASLIFSYSYIQL